MNTDTIIQLLKNAGFKGLYADETYVYMEDPSCILRSFEAFAEFAWIVITVFTGLMLAGWAISMIRGAKNDIFNNLKNLTLLFGGLSALGAIINLIYGGDVFARGCKTISAPITELNELLETRKKRLGDNGVELYEKLDIYDTGPVITDNNYQNIPADLETEQTESAEEILENLDKYYDANPVRQESL